MQETGMESAISNERFYQKAIGVVGGRGKAVSQERGRQKQVPDPKRTEPVWSVLDRTQSETVFQPHPSTLPTGVNGPKRLLSQCQIKNWFKFQGGNSIHPTWGLRSPLSRWFKWNYKMDVAPSKKTTIHSCFPLKIVSAEIFMGRIFQQLYTEGGNSYVSFPQTWFLGGIFMLISLMLESFRRKIGSERALTNYNCPVF